MASVSAGSVPIDQSYFETLVRRARFNGDSFNSDGHPANTIPISLAELDVLRSIVGKYENLRRNLLRGGVGEGVVDLLSQDDAAIQGGDILPTTTDTQADQDGGARLRLAGPDPQCGRGLQQSRRSDPANANCGGNRYQDNSAWVDAGPEVDDASCDGDTPPDGSSGPNYVDPQNRRPHFDRQCTRTVLLMNLAEGTTHGDITGAVRGGILLDIFLRSHDRSAQVSFLNSADARTFFDHVRRHDLYIKNKRVDIRWSDRQFILPGHVAAKISGGATRNLVIRQIDSRHTEENIRDDLEHIHNLVVIRVDFAGDNCYIKTNSVHNALFARMCMMSRVTFKSTKIEWDVDECAQPYVKVPPAKPRREALPAKKNSNSMPNRFHLLNLDGEDEDDISTAFQSKTSVGITA